MQSQLATQLVWFLLQCYNLHLGSHPTIPLPIFCSLQYVHTMITHTHTHSFDLGSNPPPAGSQSYCNAASDHFVVSGHQAEEESREAITNLGTDFVPTATYTHRHQDPGGCATTGSSSTTLTTTDRLFLAKQAAAAVAASLSTLLFIPQSKRATRPTPAGSLTHT